MTNLIEFPLWLPKTESIEAKHNLKQFLKLVEYYEKQANQVLVEKNIRVKYSIHYKDFKNDASQEKAYDKIFSYAATQPNVFAFYIPRI